MVRLNFEAVNYDPAPLFASKNKKRQSLLLHLSVIAAFALLTKLKPTSPSKTRLPFNLGNFNGHFTTGRVNGD